MENLAISIIQTQLYWENASKNRKHFSELIKTISSTDLIILPETFSTGFTMNVDKAAESMSGPTMEWLAKEADKKNAVIGGSLIIRDNNQVFNRFIFMQPDGNFKFYNKRHLFRMGDEHLSFTQGTERLIFEYKGWKICPQICYDLRFPVYSRQNLNEEYDLLIYVANWPAIRVTAWEKLLYARAIENQCYVAAANRILPDGNGVDHIGNSMLIDPKGNKIWKASDSKEEIVTKSMNLTELNEFRKKFPVGEDADDFEITSH